MASEWSYADLGPDQLDLVSEAEQALHDDIVMVYRQSAWGTVDPDTVTAEGLRPDDLGPAELERIRHLEEAIGGVAVAYRREVH